MNAQAIANIESSGPIEFDLSLRRKQFLLQVKACLPGSGITGLFGVSGSGKTSLLRAIAGLEPTVVGRLSVNGDVWTDTHAGVIRPVHERNIGYVSQRPQLFAHLSVRRNLEYGRQRRKALALGDEFDACVSLLGLESLLDRRTTTLSGGEAQRVAIGRALLCNPSLMLMDEPMAAIDQARRDELLPYLDRLHQELVTPVLYVSHSIDEITRLADYLLIIDDGRVAASGELQDVLVRLDVPVIGESEAGSVMFGRVSAKDTEWSLCAIECSAGTLWVADTEVAAGKTVRIRIRANDVSLCRQRPDSTSILNVLPATVDAIEPDSHSASVRVRLAMGNDRILARITRRSCAELNLAIGESVFAQIKSVAVR